MSMTSEQRTALEEKLSLDGLDGWEMVVVIACIELAVGKCFEQFEAEHGRMMSSRLGTLIYNLTNSERVI